MTVLPRYANPPVTEMVLSVQFEPLAGLTPAHLGLWWQRNDHRQRYPICEVRPPLAPDLERFDEPSPQTISFLLSGGPPVPALWFLTVDRSELLQVQPDRFTRNWTRGASDVEYPSYVTLGPAFAGDWTEFVAFLADEGVAEPSATQVEVTYVNAIKSGTTWERHGELGSVFAPWSSTWHDEALGPLEDVQVVQRHVLAGDDGAPLGRLSLNLQPVYDASTSRPVLLLTMTGRARPLGDGVEGIMATMDLLHNHVVRGFTAVTTPSMHEEWGRTE